MNKRIEQLAARRAELSSVAAKQRAELNTAFAPLSTKLAYADQGVRVFRFLARHPILVTGVVALAVYMMPKHWSRILKSGLLPLAVSLATKYLTKEASNKTLKQLEGY